MLLESFAKHECSTVRSICWHRKNFFFFQKSLYGRFSLYVCMYFYQNISYNNICNILKTHTYVLRMYYCTVVVRIFSESAIIVGWQTRSKNHIFQTLRGGWSGLQDNCPLCTLGAKWGWRDRAPSAQDLNTSHDLGGGGLNACRHPAVSYLFPRGYDLECSSK